MVSKCCDEVGCSESMHSAGIVAVGIDGLQGEAAAVLLLRGRANGTSKPTCWLHAHKRLHEQKSFKLYHTLKSECSAESVGVRPL